MGLDGAGGEGLLRDALQSNVIKSYKEGEEGLNFVKKTCIIVDLERE